MKILLYGASGTIGREIAGELLARGHATTGVTRRGDLGDLAHERLTVVAGDVTDATAVADLAVSHDAVVSAVGPRIGQENDRDTIVGAATALIDGLRKAGVTRLVTIGGAGSLRTASGRRVLDDPDFPALWKANAEAQAEALGVYRAATDLEWTYVSPAAVIRPGERTGAFRIGGDDLVTDSGGKSEISYADYAVALVDELERNSAVRRRITVAY
ncbi:NAD(P)H-binding protein [Micromonospora sp. WMMA1363]|uniref:NAD(P)-dependent oxidoreductase n=1 Tax=Micromonospora sp. WMMA1363 TaxID=3053985 RepID=UPI00259C77C0|nr:NAD(P)H-binding protein [Micromonospora sp. WMMA1363]MDM4719533.1 NAD(P)H-binding protein [Micromonospora sp. WMMA1363]